MTMNLDADWRYILLASLASFDENFISLAYDDHGWQSIRLPHQHEKKSHADVATCASHCYRKRFRLREKAEGCQQVYLHFHCKDHDKPDDDDGDDIKLPAIKIWLNEKRISVDTLPQCIDVARYLDWHGDNLLVVHSQRGHHLRLHARLLCSGRLSGKLDLDELHEKHGHGRGKTLDYMVSFDDTDGLIQLFIHGLQKKMKDHDMNRKPQVDGDSDDDKQETLKNKEHEEIIEVKTILNGPIPRLAIVMLVVGTRGDVQPFIALAKALLACGHRVRLATHDTFRKFVRDNGIEFYPLAGDPADLMSFVVKNAGIVPSMSSIVAGDVAKNRRTIGEILESTWKACVEDDDETGVPFVAEAIIANPPSYGHMHCAQKLQIPLHIVFTMPWSPTTAFPHPFCKVNYNRASIDRINMLSYDLVEVLVSFSLSPLKRSSHSLFRRGLVCAI